MEPVNTSNRLAHELHDEVWSNLQEADADVLAGLLPKATGAISKPIEWPTNNQMSMALARTMVFVKTAKNGDESHCAPPGSVVRSVMEQWKMEHKSAEIEAVKKYYGIE